MSALPPPGWAGWDQAARDAAYNNGAAVADSAALNAARNASSAALRASRPGHLDLAYGPGARCGWDLFPAADPNAPCLILIHGGWWQYNARQDFAGCIAGALARGWSAALPGYTLAPESRLRGIVAEIHAALDWLAANGPAHGIAGPKLLAGWSAGAHLAAMALDHPTVRAGMAISGVYELAPIRDTYVDDKLRLDEAEIADLSPLRRPPSAKRLVVAYGSAELPQMCAQSRAFHAHRAAAHCPGALIPVAGADHFRVLDALAADGELLAAAQAALG